MVPASNDIICSSANELLDAVFETFEILMRFLGNYLFKILSHRIISSEKHHPPKNLILDKCIYCCGKLLYLIYISFYIIFIFPSFFYKSKKFLKKTTMIIKLKENPLNKYVLFIIIYFTFLRFLWEFLHYQCCSWLL